MFIRSLNTMEKIVNKNDNLLWDGWDVIDLKEVYKPGRDGWDIPNKYRE